MDIKNWKRADAEKVWNFIHMLRGQVNIRDNNQLVYVSYLLYLRKVHVFEQEPTVAQLLDKHFMGEHPNLEFVLRDQVNENIWSHISPMAKDVPLDVLETIILDTNSNKLYTRNHNFTPATLVDLVIRLLDIQAKDTVLDICGGVGNFTVTSFFKQDKAQYYSREIDPQTMAVMDIRMDILGQNGISRSIHAKMGNAFDLLCEEDTKTTVSFDKVFGDYPWDIDVDTPSVTTNRILAEIENKIPGINKRHASDWLFSFLLVHMMKETGKAVGIMMGNSTWTLTLSCNQARKYFLEQGLIEAVIALPPGLIPITSLSASLIVFSHGNKAVRMIDATTLCTRKDRQITFTAKNMDDILNAYKTDTAYSCLVDVQTIMDKDDFMIHPSRYLAQKIPVPDGQPLGSVVLDMYRGVMLSSKQLDELFTDQPSVYQYVMMKNINDGIIDEELPYISALDKKYEKFLIPPRGLILSKTPPFKCAVVSTTSQRKILANGNMFILKIDETKANPYYLQALFESEYGMALLSTICIGSVINTFSKKMLEELVIPIPPLEKQNQIAKAYLAIQDEIKIYRKKLANASNRKLHIFDEVRGE